MNTLIIKHLSFFSDLLTAKGQKSRFQMFSSDLSYQAKEDGCPVLEVDEINQVVYKLELVNMYDEDSETEYESTATMAYGFAGYIQQQSELYVQKAINEINREFDSLYSQEQIVFQSGLLIGYSLHIIDSIKSTPLSYGNDLSTALERLIAHIQQVCQPHMTAFIEPTKQVVASLEEAPISTSDVQSATFYRGKINQVKYDRCIDLLYDYLRQKALIPNATGRKAFTRLFRGGSIEKVTWLGTIMELRFLIRGLIDLKIIADSNRWQVAANCFKLSDRELLPEQLHRTKDLNNEDSLRVMNDLLTTLKDEIQPIGSTSHSTR